jgi:hypothetical protein
MHVVVHDVRIVSTGENVYIVESLNFSNRHLLLKAPLSGLKKMRMRCQAALDPHLGSAFKPQQRMRLVGEWGETTSHEFLVVFSEPYAIISGCNFSIS